MIRIAEAEAQKLESRLTQLVGASDTASDLLKPYDARSMRSYPVSGQVNHVGNDDEECSLPVEPADTQKPLFS